MISKPNGDVPIEVLQERWKGRRALLDRFCAGRVGVRSGLYGRSFDEAARMGLRYTPKLAGEGVTLGEPHYYASRKEALDAAREYRRLCLVVRDRLDAASVDTRPHAPPLSGADTPCILA